MSKSPIYNVARQRVEKALNGLWNVVGPFDREELGELLDGAGDAVREWLPPQPKEKE